MDLDRKFPATPPPGVDPAAYEALRLTGRAFAEAILANAPKAKGEIGKLGDVFKAAVKSITPKK